jgi:hypothetical protein
VSSSVRLTLVALSLFLLVFPLALGKPGLPTHLKADEAAYYLMSLSLAHDGDLRLEVKDVDRLFQEFPYQPVNNLILMTQDGWHTVHYGKPYIYSLLAVPFAGPFGADGLLFFNMLLTVAMIWMGASYLARFNPDGLAALYSAGFVLLSAGFAYIFWIQPEVFNMAAVAACLYFGLPREQTIPETGRRVLILAAVSGAALFLAVYNKPMIAAVGIAPMWGYVRRRDWRTAGSWLAGAALCGILLAGISVVLTGTPTSYLGVQRSGFTVCEPGKMPVEPAQELLGVTHSPPERGRGPGRGGMGSIAAAAASPTGNAMTWLVRMPDTHWSEFTDNVGYFLWGRHTGLILYLPFAALSVLLFLLHGRRSVERWLILAAVAAVALFFLLQIAWNWQGGGGFVGNRYFVNVYPAFLFLVTRIRPRWTVPAGYAWAGLCLAPLIFTPFGAVGPEPTLQAHVRNPPFRWFPMELTLRNVPGYHRIPMGDFRMIGRRDQFLPRGESAWVRGADSVELYLMSGAPLDKLVFLVSSPAPRNRVRIDLGDTEENLELKGGEPRRVELRPGEATRVWKTGAGTNYAYRMVIRLETGRIQHWTRELPPESCSYFVGNEKVEENFFVGAELTYLGTGEALDATLYDIRWGQTIVPEAVRAGESFTVLTRLFNRSRVTWPVTSGARVSLSYHWRMPDGREVVREGERTDLEEPVPPGGRVSVRQRVVAPAEPGVYVLELDPVFETVSWFSDKNGGNVFRKEVRVDAR